MLSALGCAISQDGVGCGIIGVFFPVARVVLPVRPAFPYPAPVAEMARYARTWPLPGQLPSQYPMHSSMAVLPCAAHHLPSPLRSAVPEQSLEASQVSSNAEHKEAPCR